MSMDKSTVEKIAHLARMKIADTEQQNLVGELNTIIKWVEQLGELNTDNVEPLANVTDLSLPRRADKVTDGDKQQEVLANAPDPAYGFYAVPKVIE